jgi:hypothetical protein
MKSPTIYSYHLETKDVEGWFSPFDVAVFDVLLSQQSKAGVQGDLLEIGVFQGKSAIKIARNLKNGEDFHVCDIFDSLTVSRSSENTPIPYRRPSRVIFERNMSRFAGISPVVYECDSLQLSERVRNKTFRFIHVDGAHDYLHAAADILCAMNVLDSSMGIIAVDDYIMPHTVGVSVAVWEMVFQRKLIPYLMTPNKIYLTKPDSRLDVRITRRMLEEAGIEMEFVEIMDFSVLRTIDFSIEAKNRSKTFSSRAIRFLPPILADVVRNARRSI